MPKTKETQEFSPSGILVLSERNYYSTLLRFPLAIAFFLFGVEAFNRSDFSSLAQLSLFRVFKFNNWILNFFPDLEQASQIICYAAFGIAALLILGVLTRTVSILVALLALVGIISSPQLLTDPLISLFQSHLNILILGTSISLFLSGAGALSLKRKSGQRIMEPLDKIRSPRQTASLFLRSSLAISLTIIFISVFFWVDENNTIWSYYIERTLNSLPFASIPVISSIIGTSALLFILNVGVRPVSALVGTLFSILILINGISSYSLLVIIGACSALISFDEEKIRYQKLETHRTKMSEMNQQIKEQLKKKKPKRKPQKKKKVEKKLTPKK